MMVLVLNTWEQYRMNISRLRFFQRNSVFTVILISAFGAASNAVAQDAQDGDPVRMDERPMMIPTYQMGPAEKYPMFYANESYQGAQKRIYPYAMQDHLIHEREDQDYTSLWLENEFIKICVLPEIGGRLFVATDKTNDYDFFYRQHVIKPALIGMLGAWISGGVEWCAFHHHRNTTFMTIDHTLVANDDGSKTIWFGETERRHRMKWLIGLTLHPDRSYIETSVTFFNRTELPNSILYWANVAVHVNDDYQVIFPPTVQVATYHSKIDFTTWPIARGEYRGFDYSGRDISRWKNSPVSNSFFAWQLQENFMGGYDHSRDAGVVHVGDHHVVCGAKLWEWGTGSVGRAWDKILTDEDGPYAELMVGAFSDNQPDYSWIKPHEVKTFKHYWYPVRAIGGFKNANLEGAVNLEMRDDDSVFVGFHTTSRHSQAHASVTCGDTTLLHKMIDIGPDRPFTQTLSVPAGATATQVRAVLTDSQGQELVSYQPQPQQTVDQLPAPVEAPPKPAEIESTEQLYLTGLRIEQIHNPRVDPIEYYLEGLKRDPGDSRCNTMVGINYNRRGMYAQAEEHLRRAVKRLTLDYTRARGGEAHYQLGVALRRQQQFAEAYEQFARASWDQAFHAAANYELAAIACVQGDLKLALQHAQRALSVNTRDSKARNLQAAILRKLDRAEEAVRHVKAVLRNDPLNFWARNELYACRLSQQDGAAAGKQREQLEQLMRDDVQSHLELACDYMYAGFWADAMDVLRRPDTAQLQPAGTYPLLHYYLGYAYARSGDESMALHHYKRASAQPVDYCFPFRWESHDVLLAALAANPSDARAEYYLGNLLFDNQPEVAMEHWARSRQLDGSLAVVHRNTGWASYRVKGDVSQAIDCYERGLACQDLNPRLLLELDMLYEEANADPQRRLEVLREHHSVVVQREESFLREIEVLVLTGNYRQAIGLLENNFFHAQEGRSGIHDIYVDAHLLEGIGQLEQGQARIALRHFRKAAEYPENLSVGRPKDDPRAAQIAYFTAEALAALGDDEQARQSYLQAADQKDTRRWPEAQFYRALCMTKLNRNDEADVIFQQLIEAGRKRLAEQESADFFAKFGQQASRRTRNAAAYYHVGLGALGRGDWQQAREALSKAAKMNLSLPWARHYLATLTN
jgi:tetratricopeptide (TPR) repeat protein